MSAIRIDTTTATATTPAIVYMVLTLINIKSSSKGQ